MYFKLKSNLLFIILGAILLNCLCLVINSFADNISSSSKYETSLVQVKNKFLRNSYFSNIQISGTLVSSWSYNFAKPNAYNANYGDNWQNGFTVNYADITIRKPTCTISNPYGVGFHISIDSGQNIQFYKAYYGNSTFFTEPFYQREPFDIRQAYISLYLPVGTGLTIDIGKHKELLGFENFNIYRNWNDTYSLLDNAEPSTYTGILFTYNFISSLQTTLGIVNSQNTVVPIDNTPTIEFNSSYTPLNSLNFNGGFVYGTNNYIVANNNAIYPDNKNKSFYSYVNTVFSPMSDWTFILEKDIGLSSGINKNILTSDGINSGSVAYPSPLVLSGDVYDKGYFNGTSFYIHHKYIYPIGKISETLRLAVAVDSNGLFEPGVTPGTRYDFSDETLTFAYAPSYRMFKNTQFRLEFEHQDANHDIYPTGINRLKSTQNTINFTIIWTF